MSWEIESFERASLSVEKGGVVTKEVSSCLW
jgi:hypothetical protein